MSVAAYFFDEEEARLVAGRLVAGGFAASVGRGRFAGEDDDEDQPWVLATDAPDLVVEILVEEAGGWVEHDADAFGPPEGGPAPLPLPDEPIRSRDDRPNSN